MNKAKKNGGANASGISNNGGEERENVVEEYHKSGASMNSKIGR